MLQPLPKKYAEHRSLFGAMLYYHSLPWLERERHLYDVLIPRIPFYESEFLRVRLTKFAETALRRLQEQKNKCG